MAKKTTSNRTGPAKAGKRQVRLAPDDPRNTAHPNNEAYGRSRAYCERPKIRFTFDDLVEAYRLAEAGR